MFGKLSLLDISKEKSMTTPTAKIFDFTPENGFITIFIDGEQHTIRATASNFEKAKSFFIESDWDSLLFEMNPSLRFKSLYAKYESVEVKDGQVFVNGDSIHDVDAQRILGFMAQGVDCVPIFKFITRLQNNPSKRAVDELYKFLQHKNLPLTESGTFLAYKAVREDFTDKHTGKFFNGVGEVLEMPRNKVDDDKNVGCSYGFHAGTLKYASDFMGGYGHLMVVEIDPADVVSIPIDCEFQKLRTCKYKVTQEYEGALDEFKVYVSNYQTNYDEDVDREWDEDIIEDNCYSQEECSGCGFEFDSWCMDCQQCGDCCECDDDDSSTGEPEPEKPKIEIQQVLDFSNKMTLNWGEDTFQYLVMLAWLYNRRPALGNALKNFYKDIDDHHLINPKFAILNQFTSNEDAYKIYVEYTNRK
jgi:hypothetical protein